MGKKQKYNNSGHGSSLKERNRAAVLELMQRQGLISGLQKQGLISGLQKQVVYSLIPAQYGVVDGKKKCLERACTYRADFVYFDERTKELVVEDTKGFRTTEYVIKRKLMLHEHGIRIKET